MTVIYKEGDIVRTSEDMPTFYLIDNDGFLDSCTTEEAAARNMIIVFRDGKPFMKEGEE